MNNLIKKEDNVVNRAVNFKFNPSWNSEQIGAFVVTITDCITGVSVTGGEVVVTCEIIKKSPCIK